MLILKSPIELKSLSAIPVYSDLLGAKIAANYQIMWIDISPEQLLYMTAQPPEFYIHMDLKASHTVKKAFSMDHRMYLELISHLINRVLLYHSSQFTYQDEVFVAAVLQKLGVCDTEQFMRQIAMHMDRNRILTELLRRYFELPGEILHTIKEQKHHTDNDRTVSEHDETTASTNLFMLQEIWGRLKTAECSNTVCDYHNNSHADIFAVSSFQDILWMEQADAIQLAQIQRQLYPQMSLNIWQEHIIHELKPLEVQQLSENAIIRCIAWAVLENLIQKADYEVLQNQAFFRHMRRDYAKLLYGSAADAAKRFRYYQMDNTRSYNDVLFYQQTMLELSGDELQLLEVLELTHGVFYLEEEQTLQKELWQQILESLQENKNLQIQMEEQFWKNKTIQSQKAYYRNYHEKKTAYRRALRDKLATVQLQIDDVRNQPAMVGERHMELLHMDHKEQNRQPVSQSSQEFDDITGKEDIREQDYIHMYLNSHTDIAFDQKIPLMQNPAFLNAVNEHNLSMQEKLEHAGQIQRNFGKKIIIDKSQTMHNLLRTLEKPQELLQEIYENAAAVQTELPIEIERILSVVDNDTRRFYERILGFDRKISGQSTADTENDFVTQVNLNQEQFLKLLNNACYETQKTTTEIQTYYPEVIYYPEAIHTQLPFENNLLREKMHNSIHTLIHRIEDQENKPFTVQHPEEEGQEKISQNREQWQEAFPYSMKNYQTWETIHTEENQQITEAGWRKQIEKVQLVHTVREPEELEKEITQRKKDVVRHMEDTPQTTKDDSAKQQFHAMKQELIKLSEEKISSVVNQKMQTQVHTISDMVYLELERRLKNEQRRRGL